MNGRSFTLSCVPVAIALLFIGALAGASDGQLPSPSMPALGQLSSLPLQKFEEFAMPGVKGRIYHITGANAGLSEKSAYVSAVNNDTVEILDSEEAVKGTINAGIYHPEGLVHLAPDFDKLYVANGGNNTVTVFDSAHHLIRTIHFGEDEMAYIHYDPGSKQVYVSFGDDDGDGIAAIDAATDTPGTIYKTDGEAEDFAVEKAGTRIFAMVPLDHAGKRSATIQVIDRKTSAMTKWPLERAGHALYLDEVHHRLFVGLWNPSTLLVLDTESRKEIVRLPVAGPASDICFDTVRNRIYMPGGEGLISVIQQVDADHYKLIAHVPSAIGARAGYYFPRRDMFYISIPAKADAAAQVWIYRPQN